MKKTDIIQGYNKILDDVRGLLDRARAQAYKAVDNIRVQGYWQVGERIAREELKHGGRAAYSKKVIERLAEDLGFTRAVLYRILQFYKTYPIVVTLSRQLSWSHYEALISISAKDKRDFYEQKTLQNQWSVRELREQVEKRLFERSRIIKSTQVSLVTINKPVMPDKVFKNIYDFDFIKLSDVYSEEALERALMDNIEKLLLEFGSDFSIAGRQRKILIDHQAHFVDLEFFHRGIPCIVLVDLKIGRFKGEYVGQMNKYLNFYRENKMYSWEKDPIGLIICAEKGKEEAHYALGSLTNHIFIGEYKIKLPNERQIVNRIRKIK